MTDQLSLLTQELHSLYFAVLAEFINLVSSESNEVCSKEEKRTIAPEHVLKALEVYELSKFHLHS